MRPAAIDATEPCAPGLVLQIHRHISPDTYGFGDTYRESPRPKVNWGDDESFSMGAEQFACKYPPIETDPPNPDTHTFTINSNKTIRRRFSSSNGGGGAHVVAGFYDGDKSRACLAKIYDGVSYPRRDPDEEVHDCMTLADIDCFIEARAYGVMDPAPEVAGKLVPKYFGSWTFLVIARLDRRGATRTRWVRMILLELVPGESVRDKIDKATIDGKLQYDLLPDELTRLRVLQNTIEAEIAIWWHAQIGHQDLAPRNVIVKDGNTVVIVDFNQCFIYSDMGWPDPKEKSPFPPSPITRSWGSLTWLYGKKGLVRAHLWMLKTWANPPSRKYAALHRSFLERETHEDIPPEILEILESLGRKNK
ncbi:hypothetical protein B0H63DRAFT_501250 [Podospora didyma]|uniref:Protein kinase domain-containing protein n=1 Tax=Podospora didyma TaxID=330526 RepID=A0AAE0TZC2_9PEZI|nr:hypothetical protein B0H63DRAFT_501250 [Podospora didyma]